MWYTKEPNKFFQQDIFLIRADDDSARPFRPDYRAGQRHSWGDSHRTRIFSNGSVPVLWNDLSAGAEPVRAYLTRSTRKLTSRPFDCACTSFLLPKGYLCP